MNSKEELKKAQKIAARRNILMVTISGLFMVSMLLLSIHQLGSMFISNDLLEKSWFYVQSFAIIMLIAYIINLIFLIKKDPSKTYVNIELVDIIEAISKVDLTQVSNYLELITFMSYKTRDIKTNSMKSRDEDDKVIAREWVKMTKAKAPANYIKGYKQLSIDLFKVLSVRKDERSKDTPLYKELEGLFLNENEAFKEKNTISLKKLLSRWLYNNIMILANYAALILVISGFIATLFGKSPVDTYFYALSSFLLIISTIINDYNNRMKKLIEWTEQ